jgi:hypothetical protein
MQSGSDDLKKIEKLIYTNERGESVEFSHASRYHTNEVSGLNDIRNAIYSFSSMGQDGDTYLGSRIEAREIEIVGNIKERTKDEMIRRRRFLTRVLNPQLSATLTYEYGDFRRIIDCTVDNAPVFPPKAVYQGFTIQLKCLYPFWREETESRADIALWSDNFEFELEIPEDEGIEFGYRQPSLIVNIHNGGDVKTGMRVEFRAVGSVVNPSLINVDTGEFMKFNNLTLPAGEVLTVSTYYGKKEITITSNNEVLNGFRYWDIDSTYLQLAVGDNLFRYDADSDIEGLEVSIYHNNMYLGV